MQGHGGRRRRGGGAVFALVLFTSLALGCATPVGVNIVPMETVAGTLTDSILTSDEPSAFSGEYLERLALGQLYTEQPAAAVALIRKGLGGVDDHARLFALSELSYGAARRTGDREHYLASAVYAYAFLFPTDRRESPNQYDGRLRLALKLYDAGLAEALASGESKNGLGVDLTPRLLPLPFGTFELVASPKEFRYGGYTIEHAVSLDDMMIRGLRNRYRRQGIGAALAANIVPAPGSDVDPWLPPQAKVPVTAFVRIDDIHAALESGHMKGTLELYDADETQSIEIDDKLVPTASESSAVLAYRLEGAPVWDFELAGFRRPDFLIPGAAGTKGLGFLNPYRPGRIPVVFVHGTASSPARWAEMANELLGDPRIASRYQFWFFIYNSGQPVLLSAARLRGALKLAVHDLDPKGKDPALKQMVVIGHSQGGLLTKLQVVNGGDVFWKGISDTPFAEIKFSKKTHDLISDAMYFEALPFVTRVIFISTPHKGSFLAENWLGMLARRLASTPAALSSAALEFDELRQKAAFRGAWRPPTSVDNMDWSNPGLRTLYSLPIAPWVHANSIIPIETEPAAEADDGVVRYESAHIEPVESELIVFPSGHSTQSNPRTIEEVRRILYEHAGIH